MTRKYKAIMKDEIGGYHNQVKKMKTTDGNAMTRIKKRKAVF